MYGIGLIYGDPVIIDSIYMASIHKKQHELSKARLVTAKQTVASQVLITHKLFAGDKAKYKLIAKITNTTFYQKSQK